MPAYMGVASEGWEGVPAIFNGTNWGQETLFFPFGLNPGTRWIWFSGGAATIEWRTLPVYNMTGGMDGWKLEIWFRRNASSQAVYRQDFSPGFPQPIPESLVVSLDSVSPGWPGPVPEEVTWMRGDYDVVDIQMCT